MKKLAYCILSVLLLAGFTSCKYEYNYPTDPTNTCTCTGDEAVVKSYSFTVNSSDWQVGGSGSYFYYDLSVPAITSDIFYNGLVQVYYVADKNTSDATQFPLPYTIYNEETIVNDSIESTYHYSQLIDYNLYVGTLELAVTTSDFLYDAAPSTMDFRLVIAR